MMKILLYCAIKSKLIIVNARPIYDENGKFMRRSEYAQDVTESVLNNQQLISLTSTVEDVQTATAISVHYMDSDGKFVWTPETYNIIGREPRGNDGNHDIILELFSYEDQVKYRKLLDDLGPNEFLGNYTFPLTTESNEKKFVQVNARPIYDDEGNFILVTVR